MSTTPTLQALSSPRLTRRATLTLFGGAALSLAGCGGGGGGDGDGGSTTFAAGSLIAHVGNDIIVPTYTLLNQRAGELLAAVQALTAAPTEAEMDAAQAAWRAARVPWESSEGFLFGPVDALGIDPSIDSWPLDTATLQNYMAQNPNPTVGQVAAASDDVRGFHAIEYLLFGDGVSDNDKSAAELTSTEAAYLVALVQAFQQRTQLLAGSWTTSYNGGAAYASVFTTPGTANATYPSSGAVIEEIVNGLLGIADEVGNAKMAEPLGQSLANADTSKVESQYSWNSLTDFHNNIQSVMNVYTGKIGFSTATDAASTSMNGLYAFVAAHSVTLADRVLAEIDTAQKKIALVKGDGNDRTTDITGVAQPFRNQIKSSSGRPLIETAIAACNTLMASFRDEVLPLVGRTDFV